jgi:Aminoglycoside adenylyltransferase, C-terminal domain/Nucleotidyltransferase domain
LLAESFIGAYLQGSFAIGGFDTYSDVDFLIVLDGDVTDEELPLLQALHENVYPLASPWAQHLEGSYVPKQALQRFPPPQRSFWYLDNGAKHLIRSDHDDTLVVYWTLREKGIVLAGPRSRELVPPIPVDELRDEIFATMSTWRDHFAANPDNMNNRFYQPFVVLSYCRMLHSLTTGTIVSKPAAAAWATEHLDSRWQDLIRNACNARSGDASVRVRQPADPSDLARTWRFVEYAIGLASGWKSTRLL